MFPGEATGQQRTWRPTSENWILGLTKQTIKKCEKTNYFVADQSSLMAAFAETDAEGSKLSGRSAR